MERDSILNEKKRIEDQFGPWTTDIKLPGGIMTRGDGAGPDPRLRRIVQIISDLANKPWNDLRILDLGSLEGLFPIEFALRGADVIGLEGRAANIEKANFANDLLKLSNLKFIKDDVRNISREKHGTFDVIVCSGVFYHLDVGDVFPFLEKIFEMCDKIFIIDTHVSLDALMPHEYKNKIYWGKKVFEHGLKESYENKQEKVWASLDNFESFWLTRESLFDFLQVLGFSSVYQCDNPVINGLRDRETFVAVRGSRARLLTAEEVSPVITPRIDTHGRGILWRMIYKFKSLNFGLRRIKRRLES